MANTYNNDRTALIVAMLFVPVVLYLAPFAEDTQKEVAQQAVAPCTCEAQLEPGENARMSAEEFDALWPVEERTNVDLYRFIREQQRIEAAGY